MSATARIAVVIPLYNHERYIAGALRSVLDQGEIVGRVVIIDDGSADGSVEAARNVGDDRVTLIEQGNAGAHNALNRGIDMVGDAFPFTAILNSDDVFVPGRLERCVDYLTRHSKLRLMATGLRLIDDQGVSLEPTHSRARWYRSAWSLMDTPLEMAERLGVANFVATTSNFVAHTSWLRAHPFRDYRYAHDYFSLCSAAFEGALGILDEPLLEYRVHGSNTISEGAPKLNAEMLRVVVDLMRMASGRVTEDPAYRSRFNGFLRMLWQNVSSIRADVLQVVLARGLAALGDADRESLFDVLKTGVFPEMAEFPNGRLIGDDGLEGVSMESGAGEKLAALERRWNSAKSERRDAVRLARARRISAASRWLALGRLLGIARPHLVDNGKSPAEKLDALGRSLRASLWVRVGSTLGSHSIRRLMDETRQAANGRP